MTHNWVKVFLFGRLKINPLRTLKNKLTILIVKDVSRGIFSGPAMLSALYQLLQPHRHTPL